MNKAWCAVLLFLSVKVQALPLPFELFREAQPRSFATKIRGETNDEVKEWIHFFTVDDRERFDRFMGRGALYKSLIQDILVENGVPSELYYLAMIESGFSRGIRSRASAVGIWQFIAPTGRRYGLRIDREVDERLDVIRSTRAAAHYLKDLKEEFGSWYLAMAAYNCGENRVRRAIHRGRSRDFWHLARTRRLPAETVDYVPKFQAAMLIAKHPERYGFQTKTYYDFPSVRKMRVRSKAHLIEIARRENVSTEAILGLNPHLLQRRVPQARGGYQVYLPTRLVD